MPLTEEEKKEARKADWFGSNKWGTLDGRL